MFFDNHYGNATDAIVSGVVTSLSYDPDGRLLTSQLSSGGQPLQATSATYTLTGQRATATDPQGNVTRYGYDAENRLTSVRQGGATVASYAYDGQGRRKSKTVGGTTTIYVEIV